MMNKRRGLQSIGVILHQNNVRPHTAAKTVEIINQFGWELLPHFPFIPDLALSDFHLFGSLKEFTSDEEIKSTVSNGVKVNLKNSTEKAYKNLYTDGRNVWQCRENT